MLSIEMTPATVIVGLVVVLLAVLAVRRLLRNGMCDCHKDDACGDSCAGGCSGCAGCGAAERMVSEMQRSSESSRS